MNLKFRAEEILVMAERIEENGAAFYRKVAELQKNGKHAEFLLALAASEDDHQRAFGEMRKRASAWPRDAAPVGYLQAMADRHQGEGARPIALSLTGTESLTDLLATAVELEQKSILFYLGLKDMVPDAAGKARVDDIIAQEKAHVAALSLELGALAD